MTTKIPDLNMWIGTYILNDAREAVPVDTMTWAHWFESHDRHVAYETIGQYRISTVFLGLDHNIVGGIPHLFETMVFGPDDYKGIDMKRCSTWKEAEAMHKTMVEKVKALINGSSLPS
jgi:hypothetical protein